MFGRGKCSHCDVNATFLHDDIEAAAYMGQPLGFVSQREIKTVCYFEDDII